MSRALTTRQRQVLALIDRGLSNKDIAHRLGITLKTVKNHVTTINDKIPGASRETRAKPRPKPARTLIRCPFCERRFDWDTT